jgi:hypothetical protein
VRAGFECLEELSGHAGSGEPLAWMKPMTPR